MGGEDKLIWKLSRDGRFSVKSAYYHFTENLMENTHLKEPGEWRSIWRLHVPNRVRVLIWRTLRGCLPVRTNLQKKGIVCQSIYPLCELCLENEWHLFFGCTHNMQCWQESGLWHEMELYVRVSEDFRETAFHFLKTLPMKEKSLFGMLFWSLWKRRNEKVWEGILRPASHAVNHTRETLQDWDSMNKRRRDHIGSIVLSQSLCWFPPQSGRVKCNVDAALFQHQHQHSFGIGLCVRDERGCFLKAKTIYHLGLPSTQEAEAIGLLSAVSWLRELGM
ncbi:Reverse transcriptase zinc-binding domain [Sesbania bispinosa]|nr:Reverse transcriptase zinc-binding domain [Sesbania bispinosa]